MQHMAHGTQREAQHAAHGTHMMHGTQYTAHSTEHEAAHAVTRCDTQITWMQHTQWHAAHTHDAHAAHAHTAQTDAAHAVTVTRSSHA